MNLTNDKSTSKLDIDRVPIKKCNLWNDSQKSFSGPPLKVMSVLSFFRKHEI